MSANIKRRKHASYIPVVGIETRYLDYIKPFGGLIALTLVLIAIIAALEIILPWPLKYIVDNVISDEPFTGTFGLWLGDLLGDDRRRQAAALGGIMLVFTLLQGGATFSYEYIIGLIQERATFLLRSDVFYHVERLPLAFFDQNRLGDVLKRVTEDGAKLIVAIVESMGEFLVNIVKFIGFAVVMLFVNWRFSLIVLAYIPLLLYLYIYFRDNIRAAAREARKQDGAMMNLTLETLGAIREVKAFGQEEYQLNRFEERGRDRIRSALNSIRWEASFSPVIDFVQATSTAAIVWYGVAQLMAGNFTVGELLIFMSYLKDMYRPLRRFSKLTTQWQKAAASGERLAKVLDYEDMMIDRPGARGIKRSQGEIVFKNVSFAYPGAPDKQVLHDVNLTVAPGQTVAFVGHTGSGKSTMATLLTRFYDVTGGQIEIDGVDVRDIKLADLRRQFAIVPQEAVLFAGTIRDNIAFGNLEANERQIVAAAYLANAHDFIMRMSSGYDTLIGERGATLSGGQRQRIAIARALLRNAPILILDEPTAALDAQSEEQVMSAMDRLMKGRTTFIIAHRLSTIRDADMIIVLEHGRIIETGRHDTLLAENGHYAHLVRLQMGEAATLETA